MVCQSRAGDIPDDRPANARAIPGDLALWAIRLGASHTRLPSRVDAGRLERAGAAKLGIYPLSLNIRDSRCCIDYLETRPEVDRNRSGMIGLSQGGTMTTFTAAAEPRIWAADIICYTPLAISDGGFLT